MHARGELGSQRQPDERLAGALAQIKPPHIRQLLKWKASQPTTANRLKRLFSHMFNMAREWGYTEAANPCQGIKGHALAKREVYVSDVVYTAVHRAASQPLRDATAMCPAMVQLAGQGARMTTAARPSSAVTITIRTARKVIGSA
jgi:hypothetical protein